MGALRLVRPEEIVDAEVVEDDAPLSTADARALTDRIRVNLDGLWEMVIEAFKRGAHRALGYASWDEYCEIEFGSNRIRLPREERQDTVRSMREAGLSIRAIQSATGAAKSTVEADLRQVSRFGTPDVLGADGKTYAASVAAARERSEQNAREAKREWDEAQVKAARDERSPGTVETLRAEKREWKSRRDETPGIVLAFCAAWGLPGADPVEDVRNMDPSVLTSEARELFTDEGLSRVQALIGAMRERQADVLAHADGDADD